MEKKNKTIIQGYQLTPVNAVQNIGDAYYFRLQNVGTNPVQIKWGDTGMLIDLAAGGIYTFDNGNPFFPFSEETNIEIIFRSTFIINLILARVI